MKTALTIFTAVVLSVLAGCADREKELLRKKKQLLSEGKELLTVDFQEAQTLRYKFVSSRDIEVDWNPGKSGPRLDKSTVDRSSESMDMVVAYTPVKVKPYGLTTIKATCESVKVKRSKDRRKDAVESLAGKTFTFTIDPTGKIEDYSQLDSLIREIGKKAFRSDTGRIKDPDMICDFIASQWFLWDSVSSIERAFEGVSVGQTWKSRLSVPTPMVSRKARDVTYTLDEIRQTGKGRLAVIRSSYSPAESVPAGWPIPYVGAFQMRGTFGFLRGYKMLGLEGQGEELFNIDAGRIEQYSQQYQTQWEASLLFALEGAANPRITIKQKLTMQLLK